jgi:hypothetical protein
VGAGRVIPIWVKKSSSGVDVADASTVEITSAVAEASSDVGGSEVSWGRVFVEL